MRHENISHGSKLFIVTHSLFMNEHGLYEPGTETSTQDKPLNNSIYLVKNFNLGTREFDSPQLIFAGFDSGRIESEINNPTMYSTYVKECNGDIQYRNSILGTEGEVGGGAARPVTSGGSDGGE